MRPVVRRVHDDRVLGDPELVELVEHLPDALVVVDHRVVVGRLPPPRLSKAPLLRVRAEVHVRGVDPDEERLPGVVLPLDEVERPVDDLVVDRLHPLLRQRTGVLDRVLAALRDPALEDAAWAVPLAEVREVRRVRVVRQLRLLVGVQVIEVAEELVEAVVRRQVLVEVAEVVLAELPGRVPEGLEQLCDRGVVARDADRRVRHPDLAQAGAVDALTGDEGRPTGGAALLSVRVGEADALVGQPVDVRGPVPHDPVAVAAQVGDADVVAPEDDDVRPFRFRHVPAPSARVQVRASRQRRWCRGIR